MGRLFRAFKQVTQAGSYETGMDGHSFGGVGALNWDDYDRWDKADSAPYYHRMKLSAFTQAWIC